MITKFIGIFGGLGTTISFLPQVIKTMKSENMEGLSMPMIFFQLMGTSCWTIYGFLVNDKIILSYNAISVLLLLMITGKWSQNKCLSLPLQPDIDESKL